MGFLPEAAYSEAAAAGRLLVAVDMGLKPPEVLGYLLYGGAYPHIHIHQTYVVPKYRRTHRLFIDTDSHPDAENAASRMAFHAAPDC